MEIEKVKNSDEYLENLKQQLTDAKKLKQEASKKRSSSLLGILFFFVIIGIICFILFITLISSVIGSIIFYGFLSIEILLFLIMVYLFFDYGEIKQAQISIDLINDEIEIYNIRNLEERILADKQFKIHQKELKRYYDLNLSQVKFLSVLGIVLIMSGVGIVILSVTIYVVLKSDVWFFATGLISGVIFDCIGAFFISMYTASMKAVISLHSRLTGSNNLLLANLIVNKIQNKELRDSTLAEISKNITIHNND